ncbi:MAG: NYN domain-containing protein [Bacteroidales bacterium]|nr:NYN domain-containing protein [Bacteroidales bacterium]
METKMKIAVLIDGDNAEASLVEAMLSEISKFGKITIKRIYGDWTNPHLKSWKDKLNEFAIRPMQKFSYSTGKNSTDSAMIIDAMDILHLKSVDGFCLVSSDSDYTGLAHRIREEGLFIMGIGKSETPVALIKACESFIYTEILKPKETPPTVTEDGDSKFLKTETPKLPGVKVVGQIDLTKFNNKVTNKPMNPDLIESAYRMVADDMGMALASRMKEALIKLDSSFDPRNYGYSSFRKFLEALYPPYEIIVHQDGSTISIIKRDK